MIDLTTKYMGLTLKNPIIVGSCGLTNSVTGIKELETNGAAAVVLKSIFEEQILMESNSLQSKHMTHTEEADYILAYTKQHNLREYLKLIENTKKEVSIPVIPSINCISDSDWTSYAKNIEDAGADALELNMFIIPANFEQKGEDIEKIYFDIIDAVRQHTKIPIAVKISPYFSGLANMIFNLSHKKINGIVLFNRFFNPDIDIDRMAVTSTNIFSTAEEYSLPLRWIGLMSGHVKCDLAASTGIHDGYSVIKNILAGAKAVQVASILYRQSAKTITTMLDHITDWMTKHHYSSLQDITGKLNQKNIQDPVLYERAQFMKYFSNAK